MNNRLPQDKMARPADLREHLDLDKARRVERPSFALPRILLVNEEEASYLHIQSLLLGGGAARFDLEWVSTYEAGLHALERNQHDACLLDYRLGERSGVAFLRKAVENGCKVPVIFLVDWLNRKVVSEAMAAGAVDYLYERGFDRTQLERSIHYALDGGQTLKTLQETEARATAILESAVDCIMTDRKLGEAARQKLESERDRLIERLQLQVSRMPIGYLLSGPDLRYVDWNPAAEKIFGFTKEDVLGKHPFELIVPPSEQKSVGNIFARIASGDSAAQGVSENITKDGRTITCEWHNTPLVNADGNFLGLLSMALDITARKGADDSLRNSEERYRDLFENANDIIYTQDLQGRLTSLNKAGERVTGYSSEEALGQKVFRIVAPEQTDPAPKVSEVKLPQARTTYETEIITKDGRRVMLEVSSRVISQEGKPIGVQGIARDITERKHLQDQLRQAQKMEAIGRLAGGVAHDFNNLLTIILGYSQFALNSLGPNDSVREDIQQIEIAGRRATSLTSQLLAFSRTQILRPKVLDLNGVIRESAKMLGRLIGEDVELMTSLDPRLGWVAADPGQIEQVILNLAVNARDAMPRGGKLTIETRNVQLDETFSRSHDGAQTGAFVMLAVCDTGSGMDKETQTRIFEPFFTTKAKGKGTGLGLSTVYGIVKQSGAFVYVDSEPGQGTTFKIYLPRVEEPAEQVSPENPPADLARGGETILLVEDDEMLRKLAENILRQAGYAVFVAADGAEALRICVRQEGPIHLMLTDVVMPHMSGRELAELVARSRPEMRVLYMSGYTDDAIVHHGVMEAEMAFIQKPFSPESLARKVREVMDSPSTRP